MNIRKVLADKNNKRRSEVMKDYCDMVIVNHECYRFSINETEKLDSASER